MRKRHQTQIRLGSTSISDLILSDDRRDELPGILRGLQWIYETPHVFESVMSLIEDKLINPNNQNVGRPGMDSWQVFVLGVLRNGLNVDFSRLTDFANNHFLVRIMLQVDGVFENKSFCYNTIADNVSKIDEPTLKQVNEIISFEGGKLFSSRKADSLHIKTDGYVLETNVHFPTDVNLLWDCARKCLDSIQKCIENDIELEGWRKLKDWRTRLKYLKIGVERAKNGGGKNNEQRVLTAVNNYLETSEKLADKVTKSIEALRQEGGHAVRLFTLEDYHNLLEHHIELVFERLIKGATIDHDRKYFSIFERHTEWINKGKSGNRAERGHMVVISCDQHRLIRDYRVLGKDQSEKECITDIADDLIEKYGKQICSLSTDKGFYSQDNISNLEKKIETVSIPKPGKRSAKQKEREEDPEFKKRRKAHPEVESVINSLEHHGMDRCRNKGITGFNRCVGFGVLSYNLHQIGDKLLILQQKAA